MWLGKPPEHADSTSTLGKHILQQCAREIEGETVVPVPVTVQILLMMKLAASPAPFNSEVNFLPPTAPGVPLAQVLILFRIVSSCEGCRYDCGKKGVVVFFQSSVSSAKDISAKATATSTLSANSQRAS